VSGVRPAVIVGVGVAALAYLCLLCRSGDLDAAGGRADQEIAQAKFELLQAKRELYSRLTPTAVGATPDDCQTPCKYTDAEVVATKPLPAVEACVIVELAGPYSGERPRQETEPDSTKPRAGPETRMANH